MPSRWLDEQIGNLLDRLDEEGLTENTIILFWSDNGFFLGERGIIGKNYPYRRAAEDAMSISGPGIPQGESQALVQTIDALPTLCELTGVEAPAQLDGRSLLPLLHGADSMRDYAYSEFVGLVGMLQTERRKLMVGAQAGAGWDLLYDLQSDRWRASTSAPIASWLERSRPCVRRCMSSCSQRLRLGIPSRSG